MYRCAVTAPGAKFGGGFLESVQNSGTTHWKDAPSLIRRAYNPLSLREGSYKYVGFQGPEPEWLSIEIVTKKVDFIRCDGGGG